MESERVIPLRVSINLGVMVLTIPQNCGLTIRWSLMSYQDIPFGKCPPLFRECSQHILSPYRQCRFYWSLNRKKKIGPLYKHLSLFNDKIQQPINLDNVQFLSLALYQTWRKLFLKTLSLINAILFRCPILLALWQTKLSKSLLNCKIA